MHHSPNDASSYAAQSALTAVLPDRWLNPEQFEAFVASHPFDTHLANGGNLIFIFPDRARLPTSLGLWLLSFLNQLAAGANGHVHLEFVNPDAIFGYLDRNGFLQLLSPRISTNPSRPLISGADVFRGRTQGLVEIAPLIPGVTGDAKQEIVGRLVDALINFYPSGEERTRRLRNNVFTVLGELVDNVFSHSQTTLPGYVGLQAYSTRDRPRIQIGVSDSGLGIPASLRETLGAQVGRKSDAELVIEAFGDGLSRHGPNAGRGCGLPQCAALAAKYGSTLYVRTPSAQVILHPATEHRAFHQAEIREPVGALAGTHLCLEFRA